MAVVDGRYLFWGAAALETGGAELSSVTVVPETDGEIRVAVCPVVDFPAITPGNIGVYAPLLDVADKGRVFERPNVEDLNARFPGLGFRSGWRSLDAGKIGRFKVAYSMNKVGLIHTHDQVDNGAADTSPVVVPQVFRVVHMETRRVFLAERRKVHTPGRGFFDRSDPGLGEERPDVVLFYLFDTHDNWALISE